MRLWRDLLNIYRAHKQTFLRDVIYRMYDKTLIVIIVLVIGFVLLNLNTHVVEGLDINRKFNRKYSNKLSDVNNNIQQIRLLPAPATAAPVTAATAPVTAATAPVTAATAPETATSNVEPIQSINDAAKTPLPVDFKEVQGYLEKLKTYSSDAQNMSASINGSVEEYKKAYTEASNNLSRLSDATKSNADATKSTAEETLRKMNEIQRDIATKSADIQAQVNSNNIVKNEIGARINELRDIQEKVSVKSIEANNSAEMANESKNAAADYLQSMEPTGARVKVKQALVEGFSGFSQSVLEGYTFFSEPTSGKNAFDLEQELIQAINEFNTAYYTYLSDKTEGNKNSLEEKTLNLSTKITALDNYITRTSSSNPKITEAEFNRRHDNIKSKSTEIENLRTDLDLKMKEILSHQTNQVTDTTIARDSAAYTTILWTALATSALYFIFVKIE